jgi:hypothetical protein
MDFLQGKERGEEFYGEEEKKEDGNLLLKKI